MSQTAPQSQGLVFDFAELGDEVSIEKFHDWYDNEHVPQCLGVKGFQHVSRYVAVDGAEPKWFTLYEIDSLDVLSTDAYKSLSISSNTNASLPTTKLGRLNRRDYVWTASHGDESEFVKKHPSKFIVFAGITIKPEHEEEFERWCDEEHLDLISKIPGWVHSRTYRLINSAELAGGASSADHPQPGIFINIHYMDLLWDPAIPNPAVDAVVATPWAVDMLANKIIHRDLRILALYKDFDKPTPQ